MIFGHQHRYAEIDAEDVAVVPIRQRIESVAEAVLRPNLFAVRPAEIAQHADRIVEEKPERAACRARNDAAIHRPNRATLRVRAAPRRVAFHIIRCADAPKIFTVIGKAVAQRETEKFVRLRGFHGIIKVTRVGVTLVAEIKPRVRILMREDGIVSRNIFDSLIRDFWAGPGIPGAGVYRMSGRTEGQL